MNWSHCSMRRGASAVAALALFSSLGCNGLAGLGNVLGTSQPSEVTGLVRGVDTRAQQLGIEQSNGQVVALVFDSRTQVVFQNQNYPVTSLERGDEVTARVQSDNNGGYYTDLVQVNRSVSSANGGYRNGGSSGSDNVQAFEGTVRQIDRSGGTFALEARNGGTVVVSLPYNVRRSDADRFQSLRPGDGVRLYGVFLNNSRIELREFY